MVETTRGILKAMSVPDPLWHEVVRLVVYVLNRVTTKALDNSTQYEMWAGRKPKIEDLRVFGCVAHIRSIGSHLTKL